MTKIHCSCILSRALPSSRSDSSNVFVVLCVICLCVKVIIAMICCDLCDFLLTWNSDLCDFLLTWNSDLCDFLLTWNSDLCDFLLTWNSDFYSLLCIVKVNFIFISFSTTAKFCCLTTTALLNAAVNSEGCS